MATQLKDGLGQLQTSGNAAQLAHGWDEQQGADESSQSEPPCQTQKSTTDDVEVVNETAYQGPTTGNMHNNEVIQDA